MLKRLKIPALLTVAASLTACATGESLSQTSSDIPAVSRNASRIVVYRTQVFGAAVQPKILVNEKETDTCQPNQVFFIDLPPGKHVLTATTEVTETLVVETRLGAETYVECTVDFGIVVGRPNLEIVDSATARGAVSDLVFGGVYRVR